MVVEILYELGNRERKNYIVAVAGCGVVVEKDDHQLVVVLGLFKN